MFKNESLYDSSQPAEALKLNDRNDDFYFNLNTPFYNSLREFNEYKQENLYGYEVNDDLFSSSRVPPQDDDFEEEEPMQNFKIKGKIEKVDHFDSQSEKSSQNAESIAVTTQSKTHTAASEAADKKMLSKKKGRPLKDAAILIDEDKIVSPESEDYMKIRKKIQNRESQNRARQRKKEESEKSTKYFDDIIKENERLKVENKNLVQDRNFLIEQIKFLQSIISSNMSNLKHSIDINSAEFDIEKHNNKKSVASQQQSTATKYYPETKSRLSKLFSVTFVCMLGFLCVVVNTEAEDSISFSGGVGFSLKSEENLVNKVPTYSSLTRFSTVFLFILSLAIAMYILGKDLISKRKKLN